MQGFEAKAFLWALAALRISGSTLPLNHFSICEGVYITSANTELSFSFSAVYSTSSKHFNSQVNLQYSFMTTEHLHQDELQLHVSEQDFGGGSHT